MVVSRRKVRAILAAMRARLESETGAEHASRPTADTNREERGLPEWVQNLRMSMWLRSSKADQAQMFPAVEAADPSADPAASDAIPTDLNANEEEDGELSYALQKMQQQHIPLPGFSEDPPGEILILLCEMVVESLSRRQGLDHSLTLSVFVY